MTRARSRRILVKQRHALHKRKQRFLVEGMLLGALLLLYLHANISISVHLDPVQALADGDREVEVVKQDVEVPVPTYTPSTEGLIGYYAQKYGVSATEMTCTIKHESGFNKAAQNDHSTATGMAQILVGTWTGWRKEMHEDPNPNLRFDAEESIKTMAWSFAQGNQNEWVGHAGCTK